MTLPYARRGYEHHEAWAMRLVTDPILGAEPVRAIASLTGCDVELVRAARQWVQTHDGSGSEADRIAMQYDLGVRPADVIRAALVCYELHLQGWLAVAPAAPVRNDHDEPYETDW